MDTQNMSDTMEKLSRLEISTEKKSRRAAAPKVLIIFVVLVVIGGAAVFFMSRNKSAVAQNKSSTATTTSQPATPLPPPKPGEVVLTVTGYIIPQERIEISPKFIGTVKTINVRKGDIISQGSIIATLEDDAYRGPLILSEGRRDMAKANLKMAEASLKRQHDLHTNKVDSARELDEAERAYEAAQADLKMAEGQLDSAKTNMEWCTIRAPINGTILDRLVDPNEIVVPQSFGGSGGPSTAFVSMADLTKLQVEIDLNEADTPKVHKNQRCRISPEAYPERKYDGVVVEIAPQANRQKGTLQIKVQIQNPDKFLTPELTGRVDFLAD